MRSTKPGRILHLIESDGVYGAENVVLALAREARQDPTFEALVGCLVKDPSVANPLHERGTAFGLDAVKLQLRNYECAFDVGGLVLQLRRLGVALIHAHGYKASIAGFAAHLVNRTPIIATCHLWFEDSQCRWTYRVLTALERRLYRHFPRVVAVSDPIAQRLLQAGVLKARLEVIPNGIAVEDYTRRDNDRVRELRRRFKADPGTFVVLNVGRLGEQKAQCDLVEAAAALKSEHANLQVLILGEGHLRPWLEQQIDTLALSECVHLLGFQSDVADYLAVADAFVLPSIDEGLPIALLEALAARVPVVCTPVGAIPTLVEDGVSGLIIPVRSPSAIRAALATLIKAPKVGARLAGGADRALRRCHTSDVMYRKYRQIYADLLGG